MKIPAGDLNFIPRPILQSRRRRVQRLYLLLSAWGVAAFIAVALYAPFYLAGIYGAEIEGYREQYRELEVARPYYEELERTRLEYQAQTETVAVINQQRLEVVQLIDGISMSMPPGVIVTMMEVDASSGVHLKFEAESPVQTARVIVGLRSLGIFEQVEPTHVPLRYGREEIELKMNFVGVNRESGGQLNSPASALPEVDIVGEISQRLAGQIPTDQ
ncbi:MAG: hypothetical protein KJ650_09610 [Firmicutes bacterium]|nr:hypothetical protein [Bacillota bacterium]MBV1727474.1 hypothetical protein [Desulforudis sp.]MBV1735361.1 hypothetical protein [Desulforudis sp.]MDZ7608991.1 hypothetical protein [Eubacteriales bacterium]